MANKKRWIYLAIGTLLLILCGLIYGWSLFKAPFSAVYPEWSLSQIAMTFTISMTFFCLGSFAAGKLSAALKPRVIIMIAATLLLIGFVGVSKLNPATPDQSLKMLYLFYGVLGGSGVGICYNNVIATLNKWFKDKLGLASGIMMMGFGIGALVLGSVATELIATRGIFDAFFILGVAIFIVLFLGALFIKNPPENDGLTASSASKASDGMTTMEMLKSGTFWIFFCWCIFVNASGLMIISNAAPIAVAFGATAIVGMIVSVFNGVGRVVIGAIFDKMGRKKTMLINITVLLTAGIFLLLGAKTTAMALVLIGLLCAGFSYGGNPTITASFINSTFGSKYFAVNFSLANFSLIPAAIAGPLISSRLIERSNGSYETTFMAIIIIAVIAFALWLLLNAGAAKVEKKNSESV